MMPIRRPRGSIPTSPNLGDDVSNLSLVEVRDRLARNTRVLQSSLFSPSTSPASTSVLAAQAHAQGQAGPSRHVQPPVDPVRERLIQTRDALLAREAELLAEGLGSMSMSPGPTALVKQESPSPATPGGLAGNGSPVSVRSSGKQRALDTIRQGEGSLPSNAIQLPIDQTLSLGSRDYTTQTLDSFNSLTLSKTVKPAYDPLDENARAQHLARLNNFMAYKGDRDQDGDDDDDDGIEQDVFGFDDGEYEGDDDRLGGDGARHERGTGERVDEFGEDEEMWREGAAEEYTLAGGDLDHR